MSRIACLLCLVLVTAGLTLAEVATVDRTGRIVSLTTGGDEIAVGMHLRLPLKGWAKQPAQADARDLKVTTADGKRTFSGRIEVQPGQFYDYQETLSEADGVVNLEFTVTSRTDIPLEGVYLWLDLPQSVFRGATANLTAAGAPVAEAVMPVDQPAARHFIRGDADAVTCTLPDPGGALSMKLDRAVLLTIQDNREWRTETYSAFARLSDTLPPGQTASIKVALTPALTPDISPAALRLDPARARYQLHGFGGNYCFAIESPVTQYTLQHLKQAWARTELTATEWEPKNDNDDPAQPDWAVYEAADKPDSNMRREFQLARQIQDLGLPYVISIWELPGWLYEDGGTLPRNTRHRVHPDKWPELLELLGTYLQYAKRQYGVEPDLFCFNEANIGVRVLLTPEEHRDAIKRIGAHFKSLGLKTRMLLADATGPRGTHTYAAPAAADPEAMQYVGAVAFHSWGGGSADDYKAWGDLAERLKLPLLVTELGVDAGAWRTQAYDNYSYALAEARMYQELLQHARPQGTMQWEFTADYGTVRVVKDEAGKGQLVPTVRFWFVKHFCNLTPYHSQALTAESDHPKVLVTAFAKGPEFTVHVLNIGAARTATLQGLPATVKRLHAVRTSETDSFRSLDEVTVTDGAVKLDLTERSLLTLTTIAPE
ncbi:MAG: hypothetical protein KKI08_00995 [Armatimonadetes bacterium]|nr:hypothetical protein [Armatimonadota bacterium]